MVRVSGVYGIGRRQAERNECLRAREEGYGCGWMDGAVAQPAKCYFTCVYHIAMVWAQAKFVERRWRSPIVRGENLLHAK